MTPINVDHGQVSQLLTFPFYESVSQTHTQHTHIHTHAYTHTHPLNEVSDVLAFQEQGKSPEMAFLQKLTENGFRNLPNGDSEHGVGRA